MVKIREGDAADVARANAFYESLRRSRGAKPGDFPLLAEDEDKVVGVVRLCHEEGGHLVLRRMLIAADYRGLGIGTQMLRALESHMDGQDCYCLPWAHLVPFYRLARFEPAVSDAIPDFLAERLRGYQVRSQDPDYQRRMQADLGVSPPSGLSFICMRRLGG